MSKKKQHHEEHVDEAWLLPYSDMLTLLLALFIVMFAMGQTDSAKLAEMSKQFNIIFAGGSGVMQRDGSSMIPMDGEGGENTTTGVYNTKTEEDKMADWPVKTTAYPAADDRAAGGGRRLHAHDHVDGQRPAIVLCELSQYEAGV